MKANTEYDNILIRLIIKIRGMLGMVSGNLSGHLDKIGNIATKIELEALLGTARLLRKPWWPKDI